MLCEKAILSRRSRKLEHSLLELSRDDLGRVTHRTQFTVNGNEQAVEIQAGNSAGTEGPKQQSANDTLDSFPKQMTVSGGIFRPGDS